MDDADYALLVEAKRILRRCMPDCAARIAAYLRDPDTDIHLFAELFKLAADRCGMGPTAQKDMPEDAGDGMAPLVIVMGPGTQKP